MGDHGWYVTIWKEAVDWRHRGKISVRVGGTEVGIQSGDFRSTRLESYHSTVQLYVMVRWSLTFGLCNSNF